MNNSTEIRNSTTRGYVIFWDSKELPTRKSGAINSKGGILLTAFVPELNATIEHRSNGNHGRKGFSYSPTGAEMDTQKLPLLPREIRDRLEYKYTNQ